MPVREGGLVEPAEACVVRLSSAGGQLIVCPVQHWFSFEATAGVLAYQGRPPSFVRYA